MAVSDDPHLITVEQLERRLASLQAHLDERYEAQTKAVDAAFMAQRLAMQTAFIAADKAVDRALAAAEKAIDIRQDAANREFHEHLEQVRHENALAFTNSEKAITAAFEASNNAINKAESATEKRFESVNEFRAQLTTQAGQFVGKDEYNATQQRFDEKVGELQRRTDKQEGKGAGYTSLYGWAIAGLGILISVIILANTFLSGK